MMRLLSLSLLAFWIALVPSAGLAKHKKKKHRRKIAKYMMNLRHVNTKKKTTRLRVVEKKGKKLRVRKRAKKNLERHYFKDWRTGKRRRYPERIIWNLYRVAQHFDAEIQIISAYRHNERKGSRHKQATAVDFRVKGVDPKTVWKYCKRFGKVGLGWYPTSRFVHMDARKKSYYWIDDSGPGEASRYREGVAQKTSKKKRRKRRRRAKKRGKRKKHAKRRSKKKKRRHAKTKRKSKKRAPKIAQKSSDDEDRPLGAQ